MKNSLGYLLAVLKRETRRIYKDKIILFISFIAPLFGILMLSWIFSNGVIRNIPIAVVDNDNSSLSAQAVQMIDANPSIKISARLSDLEQAQKLMRQGKINAIVYIPLNFEKEVVKGESPSVNSYINNINVVSGGILKSALQKTLATLSTGVKMQISMKKGYTQEQALARSMPIAFDNHLLFNPYTNYSYFLALGLIPLIVVVIGFLGTIYAVGTEIKEGTGKDLLNTANGNIYIALTGKILPHTLIYLLSIRLASFVLIYQIGLPMNGNIWILLLSEFALIISYQAIALLFMAVTSNMRLSLSLGSAYTMMALTFSGLTFPMIAMPKVVQLLSYLFPYTFWLRIFMGETIRTVSNNEIYYQFGFLMIFFIIGSFTFKKLEKIFMNEEYWGKA